MNNILSKPFKVKVRLGREITGMRNSGLKCIYKTFVHKHTHTHTIAHACTYVWVTVCLCVCFYIPSRHVHSTSAHLLRGVEPVGMAVCGGRGWWEEGWGCCC